MHGAVILLPIRLHGVPQFQQLDVSPTEHFCKFHLVPRISSSHIANTMSSINMQIFMLFTQLRLLKYY
jgi:hypothetical protein